MSFIDEKDATEGYIAAEPRSKCDPCLVVRLSNSFTASLHI